MCSRYSLKQLKTNKSCLAQVLKLSEICWIWHLRYLNLYDRQRLSDPCNEPQGLQEDNGHNNEQLHLDYGNANQLTTGQDCPMLHLLPSLSPNHGQARHWRVDAPLSLNKARPVSPYSSSTGNPLILWAWQPWLLSWYLCPHHHRIHRSLGYLSR